ncbi:hypothetical protein [Streptomyces atriruber]|uniref:hypothetical protein n=1 Tax=Streptomyces atriruber TaxID=545121 RepID=UPI0006E1EA53|nr:hypothetical protein [Streptomyces atriruber]
MRRNGGRESEVRDVEILLDELYATAPPHFVSRRAELAARARTDGRAEDARRIRAARRPTLAAWAANLLWHSQPTESRRFLELGRGLREAYRTLDAAEIKELSDQRTSVVAAMSRQAATLAREAGHRLSDAAQQDVASTLRAVLADESAADLWATGRLEGALTPPTAFPSGEDAAPASAAPAPKARARPRTEPKAPKDELAERRRQKREQRAEKAREAADAAHQLLQKRRTERQEADASLQRARARHDLARQQVADAEQELSGAREELRRAEQERQAAEERGGAARDAVTAAERAAREAAETARNLLGELD